MKKPSVIVCERRGTWAAALGRHLPPEMGMRQIRSLDQCAGELAELPGSLLALELRRENLLGVLDLLVELGREFPLARFVMLAERGCEEYEKLMHEAGAVYFSTSPRQLSSVARLASNHLQRQPTMRVSLAAEIWSSLPWGDAALK